MRKYFSFLSVLLAAFLSGNGQQRIVSLNGTLSEMISAFGLEDKLVGVDVTSTYPASLQQKPKVGHNRNISAENVLALKPDLVVGIEGEFNSQVMEQLKGAGVKINLYLLEYSVEGTRKLLTTLGASLNQQPKATVLLKQFDQQIAALKIAPLRKKVLFVYARGAGALQVSGHHTGPDKMITLAGATNAVDFNEFKPLTTESLVAANPDVIVLFDSGLKSVGGIDGFLNVPGVSMTNAGKGRKIVSMDGALLSGFGLRLPQAIAELNQKIKS